jgi:hypothetical protein
MPRPNPGERRGRKKKVLQQNFCDRRPLVTEISPRTPGLDPSPVHVRFLVDGSGTAVRTVSDYSCFHPSVSLHQGSVLTFKSSTIELSNWRRPSNHYNAYTAKALLCIRHSNRSGTSPLRVIFAITILTGAAMTTVNCYVCNMVLINTATP